MQAQAAAAERYGPPRFPRSSILCWTFVVILLPFVTVALIAWLVLGTVLGSTAIAALTSLAMLTGVAIATGVESDAPTYASTTWDAPLFSALLVSFVYMLHAFYPQLSRTAITIASGVAASASIVYAAAKGSGAQHPLSIGATTALTLAGVLPAILTLAVARIWRPASAAGCRAAEAKIFAALGQPVIAADAAGIHALLFDGSSGLDADSAAEQPAVVMLHGYAAGTVFWMHNAHALAQQLRCRVYALDMLGSGASSRPRFTATTMTDAESFFIDSIDRWVECQGAALSRRPFVLVGHSLGGYIAAAYALRHPDTVSHVVLVSPAGIPQLDPTAAGAAGGADDALPPPPPRIGRRGLAWRIVSWGWDHDVTPGVLMRALGPVGPCCARRSAAFRASRWALEIAFTPEVLAALGDYMYQNLANDGSGEFALRHLLAPGAYARVPMGPRLVAAARAGRLHSPVTFVYGGTHDWMDAGAGHDTAAALIAAGVPAACFELSPAGHHVYLEAPTAFNDLVAREVLRLR